MITIVTDLSDKIIFAQNDIMYKREHSYCYGVPYVAEVGINKEVNMADGDEVYIYFSGGSKLKLKLFKVYSKTVELLPLDIYVFVDKIMHDIMNNKLPTSKEIFSIKMESYIKEKDNQLDFIIFNIRKKSLMLINKGGKPSHIHIKEISKADTTAINIGDFVIKKVNTGVKKPNYYTILDDGSIERTVKGIGDPIYIPFLLKKDISGLNSYLKPAYTLTTFTPHDFALGEALSLYDDPYTVMEIENFGYANQVKTVITIGAE